jgi:hypothetical protein
MIDLASGMVAVICVNIVIFLYARLCINEDKEEFETWLRSDNDSTDDKKRK